MSETLGKVTWTYHDAWNADTPYQPLSVVYHKGSSWVSKKATQNEEPDVLSASWGLIALGYSLVSSFTIQDGGGAQIQRQILMFGDGFSITDYPAQNMIKIEATGGSGGVIPEHNHDGVNSAKIDYNNLLNIPAPYEYSIGAGSNNKLPKTLNFTGDYWSIQSNVGTQTLKIGIDLSSMTSEHIAIRGLITQLDQRVTNLPNTLQLTTGNITNFPTMMTPLAHGSTHGANGSDPISINISQIVGMPSEFPPQKHGNSHSSDGNDPITIVKAQISDFPTSITPISHAASHGRGGSDSITPASIGALPERPFVIEMSGSSWTGGFFDFHFGGTEEDFTTRVGEFARGTFGVTGNLAVGEYISSKNINDSGWVDMPMINNWSAHPNHWFRYRKVNNVVWYQGIIVPNGSTNNLFCVFPPGFRPAMRSVITGIIDDMIPITGYVTSNGIASFSTNQYGSHVSMSGQFIADN